MRLYRFASDEGGYQPRLAIGVADRRPVDLLAAWNLARPDDTRVAFLGETHKFIEEGSEMWSKAESIVRSAPDVTEVPADSRFLYPLDRPASLRDFIAFEDHVKRGAERRNSEVPPYWYEAPIYYKGNHRTSIGPEDECPWPSYTSKLDFELELAMIIGKRGRDVATTDASDHIFGFTVFNDFPHGMFSRRRCRHGWGPGKARTSRTRSVPAS